MSRMFDDIRTEYVHPPIPMRGWDWCAWRDGNEEGLVGWGRSVVDAIVDLLTQEEDDFPEWQCQRCGMKVTSEKCPCTMGNE